MMRQLNLVAYPTDTPITAAEAALEARCAITDARLLSYLKPACRHIEGMTGRALLSQTWDLWLSGFPYRGGIELPLPPLQEVLAITYLDAEGQPTELDRDAWTYVAPSGELAAPGWVYPVAGYAWPKAYSLEAVGAGDMAIHLAGTSLGGASVSAQPPVAIRFTAGYGAAASVPDMLRLACCRRVAQLYDGRQDDQELWDVCGLYCRVRLA